MQTHSPKSEHSQVFSILHADGDLLMRKIIKNLFSNAAFQLDSAADGREALALLEAKGEQYDFVITEMHMKYANGYEIVSKIIRDSPWTKMIITSNMSYAHIREGLDIRHFADGISVNLDMRKFLYARAAHYVNKYLSRGSSNNLADAIYQTNALKDSARKTELLQLLR
ncbi:MULTISPECIES: response regulator [Sphingobacterium]|uniref:response regulator n=1 Tax=Sphingobacterium TaxID=28453 RepID=UPI00257DA957|nr:MULTISPECIES: response regulator [Sphingobacterium]